MTCRPMVASCSFIHQHFFEVLSFSNPLPTFLKLWRFRIILQSALVSAFLLLRFFLSLLFPSVLVVWLTPSPTMFISRAYLVVPVPILSIPVGQFDALCRCANSLSKYQPSDSSGAFRALDLESLCILFHYFLNLLFRFFPTFLTSFIQWPWMLLFIVILPCIPFVGQSTK